MAEMEQDVRLDKFRLQFEKLHKTLQEATNSNSRLQLKNREINAELVANAAKVYTPIYKLSDISCNYTL